MDDAIDRALAAAQPHPTVKPHVDRAVALARASRDDPYRAEPLSNGMPKFPNVPASPLLDALDALQRELVRAADCATHNTQQYLHAAGHLDLAARAALALVGEGLGLVLLPARRVWDLAAGLGLQVEALVTEMSSMGFLLGDGYHASYRWDIHHDRPVTSADELGPRELIEYTVRFPRGRARCEAALGAPEAVAGKRRYGAFFVDAADTDAFVLEWYAETPDWALDPVDHDLPGLAARIAAAATEHQLEFRPPVPAIELARALGAPDAYARTVDVHMSSWRLATPEGDLRVGDWRIEASLTNSPAGEPVPGLELPAALSAVLSESDAVRYVYVRRPG